MSEEIDKILKKLREPFRAAELEWRVGRCGMDNHGQPWARVLCYVTNRAIQNRLDDAVGAENWQNEFIPWKVIKDETSTLCKLSIRINGEWLTKCDAAEDTDIESVKGGISDSMKRAAVQWGIGRYLYEIEEGFAECSLDDKLCSRGGVLFDRWRKARMPQKDGGMWFYYQEPMLPEWALHDDDQIFISREKQEVFAEQLKAHKIKFREFSAHAKIERLGDIEKDKAKDLMQWINDNSGNPDAKKIELA